ncbi:MAG: TonB family protein [Kordiimonadaceae bacterium]|nr:TonB family protein [Kordiimonadaceae bacterium]
MIRRFFIVLMLIFSHAAIADEAADKAEFQKLYAQFNDLYANSKDLDPIIAVAEKVYELGQQVYGKDHMNTAVVTYNLASLYSEKGEKTQNGELSVKASRLYNDYFKILDDNDVPKDNTYINQYLQYIKTLAFDDRSRSIHATANKVIGFAKDANYNDAEMASLEFNVGLLLFKNTDYQKSKSHFERASELFETAYGPDNYNVGEAEFWVAKLDMGTNSNSRAETHFLKALDIFKKNPEKSKKLTENTHAFLVAIYEEMDRSQEATLHCKAIAEERPKDFDQFIKPLYRKKPIYPAQQARTGNSGEVLLEFDVDTDGFTRNVRVIESSSKNFESASIKAAEGYRYAPSIQNGELVVTKGARVLIKYRLYKSR